MINNIHKYIVEKTSLEFSKSEKLKRPFKITITISLFFIFILTSLLFVERYRGDYPIYGDLRCGAICNDGWKSNSIGGGTCSDHNGVREWKYIQTGFHNCNTKPYSYSIFGLVIFLLFLSFLNKAFRFLLLLMLFDLLWFILVMLLGLILLAFGIGLI